MKRGGHYMTIDSHRRLPRADRHQDQGRHHRPADDRRRRAEEFRAGHRRLRRNPRPRGRRGAQICGADHRRRRPRRRLLLLDAPGSGELGQGLDRARADGLRRGDLGAAAARQRRLSPRPLAATARSAASPSCSTDEGIACHGRCRGRGGGAGGCSARQPVDLVIRHATVIDVASGRTITDQAIAVRGGDIVAVGADACDRARALRRRRRRSTRPASSSCPACGTCTSTSAAARS